MLILPKRPAQKSRPMLVFCVMVLMALIGAQVFLGRLGAQKKEEKNVHPKTAEAAQTGEPVAAKLSDEEFRKRLTPEQYHVTREDGTEPAFRNEYWDNHRPGLYVDLVSGEPLFTSLDKYDSGTGWPSFTKPIAKENVVEKSDRKFFVTRTEIRGAKSDSHLGHVFDDGPEPTGKRYCMNSAALRFIPVEKLKEEGYERFLPLFETKQ
jgi:peptide-methionine (R)-S-oxide reductase